jgi:Cof subfamily protein (haloacid dehalogenase superfamily)
MTNSHTMPHPPMPHPPMHHPPRCILAVDMDDTLLRSDHTISPRTLDSLRRWRAAGHAVVIATGRPTRSIAAHLPAELHAVPWISYNGATVVQNGACLYENLISVAATRAIVDLMARELPACTLGLEIDNTLYLNRPMQRTSPYQVADLAAVATRPAAKILFFHDDFAALAPFLDALPLGTRAMLSAKYNLVQILADSADKADALRFLVAHMGSSMDRVVAFGDDVNDVDMVAAAGLGVAVANAVAEVLAVADRITLANDEDGVALVLEELLDGGCA